MVETEAELIELGALRYKRFVEDQGQLYAPTAGMSGCLVDQIDQLSVNFVVRRSGAIVLALRMSWWSDLGTEDYLAALKGCAGDLVEAETTIVCSRLVTSTAHADLPKVVLIFRQAYEIGLLAGCKQSVLSTLDFRIPLFERFGYRDTGRILQDAIAGPQHVMALDLLDLDHLTNVGSPLAARARQLMERTPAGCERELA